MAGANEVFLLSRWGIWGDDRVVCFLAALSEEFFDRVAAVAKGGWVAGLRTAAKRGSWRHRDGVSRVIGLGANDGNNGPHRHR